MRITLFFFLIIFIKTTGQSYTPMLDNQNEWHIGYCNNDGCLLDKYYTDGDTIALGYQYKILDGYHYISRKFLLREDVPEKKVYLNFAYNGMGEDVLLYDFSLEEGDSIRMLNPISPFPEDFGYFKLDSIRSKPRLENQTAKFYYFSAVESNNEGFGYLPVWVEGVGSLSLINAPGGDPNYFGVGHLTCFWKNTDLYFHDNQMGIDCESILKNNEAAISNVKFIVDRQRIGHLINSEKIQKAEIYDMSGRLIKSIKITGATQYEVRLNELKKGVYFIRFIENSKSVSISFILK